MNSTPTSDEAWAEAVHDELRRAKLPQLGFGGCSALLGLMTLLGGVGLFAVATSEGDPRSSILGGVAILYGTLAVAYLIPALFLLRAALTLGGPTRERPAQVVRVLKRQRQFWFVLLFAWLACTVISIGGTVALAWADIPVTLPNPDDSGSDLDV